MHYLKARAKAKGITRSATVARVRAIMPWHVRRPLIAPTLEHAMVVEVLATCAEFAQLSTLRSRARVKEEAPMEDGQKAVGAKARAKEVERASRVPTADSAKEKEKVVQYHPLTLCGPIRPEEIGIISRGEMAGAVLGL